VELYRYCANLSGACSLASTQAAFVAHHAAPGQEGASQRSHEQQGPGRTEALVSTIQQCNKLSQSQGKKYNEGDQDLALYHIKRQK